jgi:hypothetical protein
MAATAEESTPPDMATAMVLVGMKTALSFWLLALGLKNLKQVKSKQNAEALGSKPKAKS